MTSEFHDAGDTGHELPAAGRKRGCSGNGEERAGEWKNRKERKDASLRLIPP